MNRRHFLGGLGAAVVPILSGVAGPALAEPCGELERRKQLKFGLISGAYACGSGSGPGPAATSSFLTADFTAPTGKTITPQLFGVATGGLENSNFADASNSTLIGYVAALNLPLLRLHSQWCGNATVFSSGMISNMTSHMASMFPNGTTVVMGIQCGARNFATFQSFTQAAVTYWNNNVPANCKVRYVECMNETNLDTPPLDNSTYNSCFSGMISGAQAVDSTIRGAGRTDAFFSSGNLSSVIGSQTASTLGLLDWHGYQYCAGSDAVPTDFQVITAAAAPSDHSQDFNSSNLGAVESGTYAVGLPGLLGEYSIECSADGETRTQTNLGAGFMASLLMKSAAIGVAPAWSAVWDLYNDAGSGYNLISAQPGLVRGAQYYTLQNLISSMPGAMVGATSGNGNVLVWATKGSASNLGMSIVNADTAPQSGPVALSHWPVNASGSGTVKVWQISGSNYASGGVTSMVNVTAGLTSNMTLPPQSVTIVSA